jgi:hypothetical protein
LSPDNAFVAPNTRAQVATDNNEGEAKPTPASRSGEGELRNISTQLISICPIVATADSPKIGEKRGLRYHSSPNAHVLVSADTDEGEAKQRSSIRSGEGEMRNIS